MVVVRGYLAAIWREYTRTGFRYYCGINLPDGLKEYQKLEHPIITPTTKAAVFEHDLPTTAAEIIASQTCTSANGTSFPIWLKSCLLTVQMPSGILDGSG